MRLYTSCHMCIGMEEWITLRVKRKTRERMSKFGTFEESIDDVVNRAFDSLEREMVKIRK